MDSDVGKAALEMKKGECKMENHWYHVRGCYRGEAPEGKSVDDGQRLEAREVAQAIRKSFTRTFFSVILVAGLALAIIYAPAQPSSNLGGLK
jgi:hypothetical protein